jgi:hypothetical protein
MRLSIKILLFSFLVSAGGAPSLAMPTGPNGEKCDSSATGVKHTINGKEYTCDKCVFTRCDTSGGQISNCRTVTHWSNCVEAAAGRPGAGIKAPSGGLMKKAP